jgi:hypothetical protein
MTFYVPKWYLPLSVFLGGGVEIEQAPGRFKLHPRRSQEVRGRPKLQNGGLRAPEDAWMTTFRMRHFPVKSVVVSFAAVEQEAGEERDQKNEDEEAEEKEGEEDVGEAQKQLSDFQDQMLSLDGRVLDATG